MQTLRGTSKEGADGDAADGKKESEKQKEPDNKDESKGAPAEGESLGANGRSRSFSERMKSAGDSFKVRLCCDYSEALNRLTLCRCRPQ